MVIRFMGVQLQNAVFQPAKLAFWRVKDILYDAKGILLEIGSLRGFCLHDAKPVP